MRGAGWVHVTLAASKTLGTFERPALINLDTVERIGPASFDGVVAGSYLLVNGKHINVTDDFRSLAAHVRAAAR